MTTHIRLANQNDAEEIWAIYAPIVRDTVISFELEPPTIAEMQCRLVTTLESFPWLVWEQEGSVRGYAYAGKHRVRAAYQWSVDVSVYIHAEARRTGIGRALYHSLFAILRLQGYYNAYAGIALPNPGSVGLHEALGFVPAGVFRHVGYKLGEWHDVGYWQLGLQTMSSSPRIPRDISMVQQFPGWEIALAAGEAFFPK